jgi:hypothetical protein
MDPRLTYEVVAAKRADCGRRAESSHFEARVRNFGSHEARSVGPIAVTVRLLELRAAQPLGSGARRWRPFARWRAARPGPSHGRGRAKNVP